MSVHLSFSLSASLLPGERVLLVKRWVWGGSVSSLPTYRWIFSIPPLCEVSIYMTDRRVLWHGYILRLVSQEFSQWFGDSGDGR